MKLSTKLSAVSSALTLTGMVVFAGPVQASKVTADLLAISGEGSGGGGLFTWERSKLPGTNNDFTGTLLPNTSLVNSGTLGTTDPDFVTFCLEPSEYVSSPQSGPYTYDVQANLALVPDNNGGNLKTPMTVAKAGDLKRLFGGAYPVFGGSFSGYAGAATDEQLQGALQRAVWEVVYELNTKDPLSGGSPGGFDYDVTGGSFTPPGDGSNTTVINIANNWLRNLGSYKPANGLVALTNKDIQDQIAQVVPIPAAAWLFGSAILGVVALGRRKQKEGAEA